MRLELSATIRNRIGKAALFLGLSLVAEFSAWILMLDIGFQEWGNGGSSQGLWWIWPEGALGVILALVPVLLAWKVRWFWRR
jgi:hypothetical protein